MQTAVLCYAQPMNNEYSLRLPLFVTPIRILPVNKILRSLGRIQSIANSSSMYTKSCSSRKQQTFGKVGGMSRKFAKIEDKKLLRKTSSKILTAEV